VLGLLRRLLGSRAEEAAPAPSQASVPWYLKEERETTTARLDEARRRLKETIPPPEGEDAGA